eukprot:TRINITY_DN4196_c0_g1_i4.p1 TRINITY_DN4196_c0_g1~~TRINITY_DN4196_c0_g1_i4.p1  ORF type:complete len:188 (+),score=25.83 TRINITY_DN4196_c0_g1_i4:115-678(+)
MESDTRLRSAPRFEMKPQKFKNVELGEDLSWVTLKPKKVLPVPIVRQEYRAIGQEISNLEEEEKKIKKAIRKMEEELKKIEGVYTVTSGPRDNIPRPPIVSATPSTNGRENDSKPTKPNISSITGKEKRKYVILVKKCPCCRQEVKRHKCEHTYCEKPCKIEETKRKMKAQEKSDSKEETKRSRAKD